MINDVIKISLDGKLKLGGNERPKGDNQEELKNRRIIIGEEEFRKLLAAPDDESDYIVSVRDKAMLAIFMTTGMRKSALIEMNIEDVNFDDLTMSYIDKRKKYFTRNIDDMVLIALKDWLEVRPRFVKRNPKGTNALFVSNRGSRFDANNLMRIVKKYSKRALGYEISPHKLRSGFITIMYNHNHDIEMTRRIIGHSNVATTQRYIRVKNDTIEKERTDILKSIFD